MRVHELEIRNFKGVRELNVAFAGRDVNVYGANETGKSTLADALIWLITGKDAFGRSELAFGIKTLDDGTPRAPIPMIDHSVRALVEHGGEHFELYRNFKEVWQKKTGTTTPAFTGHKTEYAVNGIPKSEKEYTAFIDQIVPVKTACLLMVSGYFSEQIKQDERRRLLIEMCGDVSDMEILDLPQFEPLRPLVGKLVSVADLKKQRAAQKTKINDELKSIPVQVDTHSKYLIDTKVNVSEQQAILEKMNREIENLMSEKAALGTGEQIAILRRELSVLEAERVDAETAFKRETRNIVDGLRERLDKEQTVAQKDKEDLSWNKFELQRVTEKLKQNAADRKSLLAEFHEMNAREYSTDGKCPTCGQDWPEEYAERDRERFNEEKSAALESIKEKGKAAAERIEEYGRDEAEFSEQIAALAAKVEANEQSARELLEQIGAATQRTFEYDESAINAKKHEIANFGGTIDERTSELEAQIVAVTAQKTVAEGAIAMAKVAEDAEREIAKLKARERVLAGEFEECEHVIALCDEFTRLRVKTLDDKISGMFEQVTFKLTELLVNGGMKDTCEALIKGVPYASANTAGKTAANLDIIKTFQRHYGVELPVFVDNKESVTTIPEMDCQVITLTVSPGDATLRFD